MIVCMGSCKIECQSQWRNESAAFGISNNINRVNMSNYHLLLMLIFRINSGRVSEIFSEILFFLLFYFNWTVLKQFSCYRKLEIWQCHCEPFEFFRFKLFNWIFPILNLKIHLIQLIGLNSSSKTKIPVFNFQIFEHEATAINNHCTAEPTVSRRRHRKVFNNSL